jgi:hypothetical protein
VRIPPQPSDAHCPFRTNGTNYPSQCSVRAPLSEGGVLIYQVRPESEPDWTPGPATALEHDGVHSLADALSPVLIQAVRDTPRR